MKLLNSFIGPSLLALALCVQVASAAPRHKRIVVVVKRSPIRYRAPVRINFLNVWGNAVGSMGDAQDAEWNSGRFYEQTPDVPQVPYVKQYAEPPALTEIVIESNPPGARVSINGQPVGVTPQTRLEKPGAIYLLIRAEGYEDEIHEFLAGDGPVHILAELKRHVSQ